MKAIWNALPIRFVREMTELYFSKNISRSAAELAYFLILTFFPILICINSFIAMLHLDIALVLEAAEQILPQDSLGILGDYIAYITDNQSPTMLLAGISMTFFSASAALRALMNIINDIYGRKSYMGIWQVLASLAFSLLLLVTIYLSVAVVITGNWFFRFLENLFNIRLPLDDWDWIRFLLLFLFVFLFITLVYRLSAPRGKPRPPVLSGALLAALLLVGASMLFSWFIGLSSRYSLVYGSLASVIILLVWLYLCGNILIIGNLFNAVWHRHKKSASQNRSPGQEDN